MADDIEDDLDAWIQESVRSGGARGRAWDAWPAQAFDEIRRVLKHNDSGSTGIPLRLMAKRLKDRYGIHTNGSTISRYCRVELGRTGWIKP